MNHFKFLEKNEFSSYASSKHKINDSRHDSIIIGFGPWPNIAKAVFSFTPINFMYDPLLISERIIQNIILHSK